MSNNFWCKSTNRYRVFNLIKEDIRNKNRNNGIKKISKIEKDLRKTQKNLRTLNRRGIRRSLKNKYIFGGRKLSEWEAQFVEQGNFLRANLSQFHHIHGIYRLFEKGRILYVGSAEDIGMELSKFRRLMRKKFSNEIKDVELEVLPLYSEDKEETEERLEKIMLDLYKPKWNEEVDR